MAPAIDTETTSRLAAVESKQVEQERKQQEQEHMLVELTTIRRTLGALSIAVVLSLGGGAVTVIQALTRLDMLERTVREHEALPSHRGTVETLSTLRGDLREIAAEVRSMAAVTSEMRTEVRALTSRMDASVSRTR